MPHSMAEPNLFFGCFCLLVWENFFCCCFLHRLKLNTIFIEYLCKEPTHWKISWCWERLRTAGEEGNRRWDGWMASSTPWPWVWANSRRCGRTGKSGVLQSMWSQRGRHGLATEQQQQQMNTERGKKIFFTKFLMIIK